MIEQKPLSAKALYVQRRSCNVFSLIPFLLSLQISFFLPFQVKVKLKLLRLRYFIMHKPMFEDIVAQSYI